MISRASLDFFLQRVADEATKPLHAEIERLQNALESRMVYTAERHYDYEGSDLLGIFTTKEAAQAAIDGDVSQFGNPRGDSHQINAYELGELYAR
jgi:hypothetical protein